MTNIKELSELGQTIFEQRYAFPGEKTYTERAKAMAEHMAAIEKDEDKERHYNRFFDALRSGDLIPGGRIIFGSGRSRQNLLNCYAIEPEDSVESIGKVLQDMYRISCGGGGIGFNFSKIRPRGDDIGNINNSAPGAVSVMKMVNEVGNHVKAGKNRRTALMAELNVTHPDLLEFLRVKLDLDQLQNFNISVAITDRFIEACENNEDWYFFFNNKKYYVYQMDRVSPDGSRETINSIGLSEADAVGRARNHLLVHPDDQFEKVEKYTLKAIELWDRLWANAVKSGDPGIFNLSLTNRHTNVSYFLEMNQTNPSLKGDTLVHTKRGAIPIREIAEKTPLTDFYTFNGKWARGLCRLSGKNKQLYKITFHNGSEAYCTPEHKWPILDDNALSFTKKETKDLLRNDRVYLPSSLELNNENDTKSFEEGFVLGWNLGDGWRSYHKTNDSIVYGFIFSKVDYDNGIADRVLNFMNSKFGISNSLRENKGCYETYFGSKKVHEYFMSLGHEGKENGIPSSVWRGNKEFISGFIDGLFSSDGYVSPEKRLATPMVCLTTAHKELAIGVRKLLLMHGISSNIAEGSSELNGKSFNRYDVEINTLSAQKFSNKFSLSHSEKQRKLNLIKNSYHPKIRNTREYLRVEKVEPTLQFEDVYDITIQECETHTFAMETGITGNCGEIPLESYANCCLGHINLVNMLNEDGLDVDWRKLARTIRVGIRFLDNVLTANHYPIPECKLTGERSRRIGLGTLGLHHMLIKLGIKYGSEKCLEFLDRLYSTIRNEAYLASMYLAKERGSFPEFRAKQYLAEDFARDLPARIRMLINIHGIRNAVMLTAAPTGTISMVHSTSTGIEPIFSGLYKRRFREGNTWREVIVMDPMLKECIDNGKDYSHIVGAYDVTPEQHMAVQATIQRYIDNAISKTINLPNNADSKEISRLALKFAPYLKGLTVYRAGSRGMEPITPIELTVENINRYYSQLKLDTDTTTLQPVGQVCNLKDGSCGE